MKKKKIIRLLRQADAEEIAKNWKLPDEAAGERIYEKCRRSVEDLPEAEVVQGEAITVQHSGAGRFVAAAAVVLLIGGTAGGIGLMQHMHSSEPVPAAEEQSAATVGAEPDTQAAPVLMEDIAADRAASEPEEASEALLIMESNAGMSEPVSQPVTQAETDATGNAAKSTTPAAPTTPAKDSDPTETPTEAAQAETTAQDARMEQIYQQLLPFAAAHSEMTVIRAGEFWNWYVLQHPDTNMQPGKDFKDDKVVLAYPNPYESAYGVELRYYLNQNGLDEDVACYPIPGRESQLSDQCITLAEAETICAESSDAWEAARTISSRYHGYEVGGKEKDSVCFYFDGTQNEAIMIKYNGGVHIYYKNRRDDPLPNRVLATTGNAPALYPADKILWSDVTRILEWERVELAKDSNALSDEQKAQLRALEEEEKDLWCTSYIRRRLEIVGALNTDAPRLTLEEAERICGMWKQADFASKWIKDNYAPDYSWGSGVDGYAYVLSDHETLNIVNGSSIYYEDTSTDPATRKDLYE